MTWGRGPFRLRTQKKSARRSSPRAFFYPFCGWGFTPACPALPARDSSSRRWASASSSQSPPASASRFAESAGRSLAPPLPTGAFRPAGDPEMATGGGDVCFLFQRVQLRLPEIHLRVAGHPPRRHKVRMPLLPALRKAPAAPLLLLSPPGLSPRRGPRKWRLAGETSVSYSSVSSSACQRFIFASLGIRQSPRGDMATVPTLGPSGRQLRLNCWLKKRR